jgi:thiol-disulfide isomerase/thioredoxin
MDPIHIEIIFQGEHCPACFYMAEAVEEVLPNYGDRIQYSKVEYMKNKKHARRFYDLSVALYGEDELRNRLKCAPIPSLFINGELVFDIIPPRDELVEAIEKALNGNGQSSS